MNNKVIVGVIVIVVVLAIGAYMFSNYKTSYTIPVVPTTNSIINPTSEPVSTNTIIISGYTFTPSSLTIKIGDTVTWINQDSAPHDIISTEFTSPALVQGDKFEYIFNNKGTFVYNCGIHPTMTGTIIVE